MDLTLYRHPPVTGEGLCYGRAEVPLAPGAEDAIAKAVLSPPRGAKRLVASPAARCRALAEALAAELALEPEIDPRLQELDFGLWEGRKWTQIPRAESDAWADDPVNLAPPEGERFADLQARIRATLSDLGPAVVVTHAGPIRAIWMDHLGLDFATAFRRPVPFATPISVTRA